MTAAGVRTPTDNENEKPRQGASEKTASTFPARRDMRRKREADQSKSNLNNVSLAL